MASRLQEISAKPELRDYAQGAAQDAVQPVAEFLAPTVPVSTSVGRFKAYTEKNRFKIPDTLRGMGGRAVELSFAVTDNTYNCAPHALDFPVDNLEQMENAEMENVLQEGATLIAEVAGLAHEAAVINAAVGALGTAVNGAGAWSAVTTADPVGEIDTQILEVLKAAKYGSLMGIGVLFGATAFRVFKNHASCRSRFVTAGGNAIPNITPDSASSLLMGQPDVRVSYMVQDTAAEGQAASMSFLLDSNVIVFARKASPSRRDPSFMKTFRLRDNFMVPGSYIRDDGRVEVAKFDWSEDIQITNAPAAKRIAVT